MSVAAHQLVERIAPALVQLHLTDGMAAGFLFSGFGHVATSLHAISGTRTLEAQLADGRRLPAALLGLDSTRDLAVLRLELDAPAHVALHPEPLPLEGDRLVAIGLPGPFGLAPVDTRLAALRVLDPELTVLELARPLTDEHSGGPLLDAAGRVVALAAAARADGNPVGLGIPARYLVPFLSKRGTLPLSLLGKSPRRRRVPEHPPSLLASSDSDGLEQIAAAIIQAINSGAPLYNQGDAEGCFRIYEATARRLRQAHTDCPGAGHALLAGLERAGELEDADARAWALRDAFDGLLAAIERHLEAVEKQAVAKPARKTYLN